MFKFWSETPGALARELMADIGTWVWVALWALIGEKIFLTIAAFAETGRVLQRGGVNIQNAGVTLGDSLHGIPLVGQQAQNMAASAFRTAGDPFIYVGMQFATLVILIASLLTVLVLAVMLIPWLTRYVPWRARRLARLRAANQVIRRSPKGVSEASVNRVLASRALHRLDYTELLAASSDPIGDFVAHRYDRLARAELNSVGLERR